MEAPRSQGAEGSLAGGAQDVGLLYHHVMERVLKKVKNLLEHEGWSEDERRRRLDNLRGDWKNRLFTDLGGSVPGWPGRVVNSNLGQLANNAQAFIHSAASHPFPPFPSSSSNSSSVPFSSSSFLALRPSEGDEPLAKRLKPAEQGPANSDDVQEQREGTQEGQEEKDDQEEVLCSDDDGPEDFEPRTGNLVVCKFENISRKKKIWKVKLRDGVMNINGREFCFSKADWVLDWDRAPANQDGLN